MWGGGNNISYISPEELRKLSDAKVVIGTENYCHQISKQLQEYNNVVYTMGRGILYWREKEKLDKVYHELLLDEESKKVYLTLIEAHVSGNMEKIWEITSGNQYFAIPQFAVHKTNDVFIDCGGSVGDSIEQFINKRLGAFQKIYSFEPMQMPYTAMIERVKRLQREWAISSEKIICENKGVTDKTVKLCFDSNEILENMFMENNNADKNSYSFISLDDYFLNLEDKITFIKADIETFEMKLLEGAKQIIQRDKPNIAICVYHKFNDIYEIPLKIHEFLPEYKMQIRHHGYNFWETVLYCYI